MEITYYGHSCFAVEAGGKNLLFDPFITGNDLAQDIRIDEIQADYIFVSHGHFDHMLDVVAISAQTGATVISGWELYDYFTKQGVKNVLPLNPGGKATFDFGTVKAFIAQHSSSLPDGSYAGVASGFAVKTNDGNFYYSGDTGFSLDMGLVSKWADIDFAVFPIGDMLTMGIEDSIEAAKLIKTTKILGVHYDTFGFIKIDKSEAIHQFKKAGLTLYLPEIGSSIKLSSQTHETAPNKFIEVEGIRYAYRTLGDKASIPLLLLQHFTGTLDNWDPSVVNGLAKYFQVILFDNKGIGASEGETPDHIGAMAQDAIAFIKAMDIKKVNILGFSMGGFIAQQIVLHEPDLVNKLILAGTGPKGGAGIADIVKPLTESASLNDNDQKLFLFYTPTRASRELGQQALDRIYKRKENRDKETSGSAIQSQLVSILRWGEPDAEALNQLKQIEQPVLVINGSNDIVVPTINSYVLFQNLPNAKLSLYPDSGHGSIFQYPDRFLSEVVPFLKVD